MAGRYMLTVDIGIATQKSADPEGQLYAVEVDQAAVGSGGR